MTRAYSECYLDDAKSNLGTAVEYAVLHCGIFGSEFLDLFVKSGIADLFGSGCAKYVTGMSGVELAESVFLCFNKEHENVDGEMDFSYPPEYWCGWILAHYQWWSGLSFQEILSRISYDQLRNLYILHEASEQKALSVIDGIVHNVAS